MFWFAFASLVPAVCLGIAALWGGLWPVLAVMSITVVVFAADRYIPAPPDPQTGNDGVSISYILVITHIILWCLGIWALGTEGHLDRTEKILTFIGFGLFFGQISNSNAHELIHRTTRLPRALGEVVYASLLHAHHVSAHLRVHHVHAATARDPNTARLGEGYWRYMMRAPIAEFIEGWRAETDIRARRLDPDPIWTHPYVAHLCGMGIAMGLAWVIAGKGGLIAFLLLSLYAQIQLYLSDYVQHYGLERRPGADGRLRPVGVEHSWNAPHWYSSAMMLNAPRHSDHHIRPARAYPQLDLSTASMPTLPHSLPVMAVVALLPPLWRRIMDPRVEVWRQRDILPTSH